MAVVEQLIKRNADAPALPDPASYDISVVSLKRSTERRERFAASAPRNGLNWRFFDACEGLAPGMSYEERDSLVDLGRVLHQKELGCYASHFSLWKQIAASSVRQALIVEDDVVVDWDYVRQLMSVDLSAKGIDYLKLYNVRPVPFRIVDEYFLMERKLIRFSGFAYGTQAYVVTPKGAARLMDKLARVTRPIDHALDRDWHHGLPNLAIFPSPAFELAGTSTIGDARRAEPSVPSELAFPRFMARARERIARTFLSSNRRKVPGLETSG